MVSALMNTMNLPTSVTDNLAENDDTDPEANGWSRAVSLNADAVSLLLQSDHTGAVANLSAALSYITRKVLSDKEPIGGAHPGFPFQVRASFPFNQRVDPVITDSCVSYFEKPFLVEWQCSPQERTSIPLTDEIAAYLSATCFYNMGLALYATFRKHPLQEVWLSKAHDSFLRAFELLSVLKIRSNNPTLLLLLATCNNLAAIQGDLGNVALLHFWGDQFQIVFDFADAQSLWNDSNFHSFRLKKLLHAFAFSAAGTA